MGERASSEHCKEKKLNVFKHNGFWQPMDTLGKR